MHASVDWTRCENHGQCAISAPDVFEIGDDGTLHFHEDQVAAHADEVLDAADVCPAQAILLNQDR
ncbi:ferredoxin [Mycobacterium sp. SMC-4]|uniref:ferredoxin n=1 Tax=Mycobacterium sp. SMC-4 TaxID=2857059 RepID=UPI003CFFAA05